MTQQSVYVQSGTVTTVHPQLAAGATIYNGDADNAVWVSSHPSVSPSNGMRIGPKGSLQWTTNNAPCYACTDLSTVDAVTLTVSTDIANLNNPVDIGVAVATQLLAQGVPSVFLGDVVASGTTMTRTSFGNFALLNLDVSRYASLTITIDVGNRSQISATCTSDAGGNLGSFDFPVTRSDQSVTFIMPVTGPKMNIVVVNPFDANTQSYTVYGSNRASTGPRIMTGYSQHTELDLPATSYVNGVTYEFPNPFHSNGKPAYVRMVVTAPGVGKFGYVGFNSAGTEINVDLIDTATGIAGTDGQEIETYVNLPPGVLSLYYYSNVTALYIAVISVVQEHY